MTTPDGFSIAVIGRRGEAAASVAMDLVAEKDGFRLSLLDRAGRALLKLGPYSEDDVVAEWRALGAAAQLPLVMLFPNGAVLALYDQVGPVQVGHARAPDRRRVLNGRRPRFLTRRKTGRLTRSLRVFREPEIASGRGA